MGSTGPAETSREASPEFIERSIAVILKQAKAGVVTALLMAGVLGFILVPKVGWAAFLGWYGVFAVLMVGRQPYFRLLVARDGTSERTLRRIAIVAALTGWVGCVSVPLFAGRLAIADLGVLTIIFVGWVSVAVSILAVQPRIYAVYLVACLGTVYLGWVGHANRSELLLIGLGMVLGGPMMARLGWTLNNQLRETVEAGQEKALLVEQLREALKNQQEAQRARSRFLGAASHDLRQPVQALLFLSDIFRKSSDAGRRDTMAQQIIRTGESIDHMFRHLVDFAQIDAGTMKAVVQPVQIERLVASASSGFAEKCAARGLRFRTEMALPCTVSADPVLLERMLRNFLDNAFKYSKEGEIVLRVQPESADVVVSVTDQGVGMDPDDLAQACNAFYRGRSAALSEAEGIGLGLAISNHMADLMHSRLQMDSQPGQGTRVGIRLKMAEESMFAAPVARGEAAGAPLRGLLVAVVENDRLAREALCAWLEEAGARVAQGSSLAQLQQALHDEQDAPDFMLADYRLAQETGVAAVEAVRARFGPLPALIISGEPDIAERRLPLPVLQKPVTPERLLEAMQAGLARPQPLPLDTPA